MTCMKIPVPPAGTTERGLGENFEPQDETIKPPRLILLSKVGGSLEGGPCAVGEGCFHV